MNKDTQKEWWKDLFEEAGDWMDAKGPSEMPSDKVEKMVRLVIVESRRRTLEEVRAIVEEVQKKSDSMWPGDSVPFSHACSTILDKINGMMEK